MSCLYEMHTILMCCSIFSIIRYTEDYEDNMMNNSDYEEELANKTLNNRVSRSTSSGMCIIMLCFVCAMIQNSHYVLCCFALILLSS